MLDLSAAFDTIDCKIMLSRLRSYCSITGNALKWFKSYMENRTQTELVKGSKSEPVNLSTSVPQGFVLLLITIVLHIHASTLSNYEKTWYIIPWIC